MRSLESLGISALEPLNFGNERAKARSKRRIQVDAPAVRPIRGPRHGAPRLRRDASGEPLGLSKGAAIERFGARRREAPACARAGRVALGRSLSRLPRTGIPTRLSSSNA